MTNWTSPIAYVDAQGTYPAKFDFDADPKTTSYVRVIVCGDPKFQPTGSPNWRMTLKFDEATGKCLSDGFTGKIVNSATDLMADIDLATGRERTVPISEHRRLLQEAVRAAGANGGDPITSIIVTVGRKSGAKDVVGTLGV